MWAGKQKIMAGTQRGGDAARVAQGGAKSIKTRLIFSTRMGYWKFVMRASIAKKTDALRLKHATQHGE
jgi:hypothetical protein